MMELFRQIFLNPQMLFGTALIAIPVIIYLINRQRFQRRKWAAMEFLLRAMKRNKRRIQVQNLLLLLIRIAVLLFLVLAVARPVYRQGVLTLAPDKNQSWLLALDTSYSMSFQEDARSLFDQARETISQMSDSLFKAGDQVALMTWGKDPRILLPPTRLSEEGRTKLLRELEELKPSTRSVDLGASFSVLDELCGKFVTALKEPEPKRVVIFSDFQQKDWLGQEGSSPAGVAQFIEKVEKEGGEFAFAHLSPKGTRPNLAVTDLSVTPALIAKDVWVDLRATVRNFSEEDLSNIDLTIQVDRDPDDATFEAQTGDVIRVPAGGAVTRVLHYKFTTPGYHTAFAQVRSDGLLIDNRRFLAVKVEETVKVLLVDGDPAANPLERETFHLQVALEPEDDSMGAAGGRYTPFQPEYVTSSQLSGVRWKDYSVVVLANVAEMTPDQAGELTRYVKGGGAVMVFLGSNVRPEFYNKYFGPEGNGLGQKGQEKAAAEGKEGAQGGTDREESFLPVKLEGVRGDERFPVNLQVADAGHPVAQYFDERKEVTHLQRPIIFFNKYYRVSPIEDMPGVRVMFRYTDTDRSPAIFDNAFGNGRVLWVTSSADQDWNDFSSWPDFVVFLYESISYLVRFGMSSSNLIAGEVFRKTYSGSQYASEVTLLTPEAASHGLEQARTVRKAMRNLSASGGSIGGGAGGGSAGSPSPADAEFELTHEDTETPGIYRLDLQHPQSTEPPSVEFFAVNIATLESQLKPMTDEDFKTSFPNLQYELFDASQRIRSLEGEKRLLRGREYWQWVLGAVLTLLAVETVLAYLFGRRAS
jgi:hypothetical protein